MKILVTGAAGFIGFHTCLKLINQGTGVVDVAGTTDYERQIFEYSGAVVDFTANPIIISNLNTLALVVVRNF